MIHQLCCEVQHSLTELNKVKPTSETLQTLHKCLRIHQKYFHNKFLYIFVSQGCKSFPYSLSWNFSSVQHVQREKFYF